jgi:hypothetical protein
LRQELGIVGTMMLRLEVRESNNAKEIVIRRDEDLLAIFEKYRSLAEIISRIAECTVAVVWNGCLMSMSFANNTESFVGKSHPVDISLYEELKNSTRDYSVLSNHINFLPNNKGEVLAYYRIPDTGDDSGFFVLLKGTKQDSGTVLSSEEYSRRYMIISDVIKIGKR